MKQNNYTEAFRKYESILFEEPTHAATHNSLGWIYKTQLDDFRKAESHFTAAIRSEPHYPHAYLNFAVLLMDLERYDELEALVQKALDVPAIEKSWLYHRLGLARELQLRFDEAVTYYEKAILMTLNDDKIKAYRPPAPRRGNLGRSCPYRSCHSSNQKMPDVFCSVFNVRMKPSSAVAFEY
ncbi:tetratricopeptide repeat protein [Flaviaesturariibacter amylovorans]|uniref:Tetratricopeptide repeat protein n=1 Tax=Flaviaesturariibacter amylovorans TaxID=1084520 RepID=A0ABP8HPF1_9BACT